MKTLGNGFVAGPADYKVVEADWGRLTWYVSGELGNSTTMTVGRCEIHPGFENPMHRHPTCDEVLHVTRGEIVHRVEGADDIPMRAGDTITVSRGALHNAFNAGEEDAVMLVCFSSAARTFERG